MEGNGVTGLSTSRLIFKATLVIALFNLLSRVLGFVREMVIARQFGATATTDAYLVAYTIPYVLFAILSQALAAVVVPVFTEYAARGERREAWHLSANVINLLFVLLAVVAAAGILAAPLVVKVVAPGLPPETSALAADLSRIMFPTLVFAGVATLFSGFLNANNIFGIPAFSGAVNNIVIIVAALTAGSLFGIRGLAWGTVAGMVLSALVQVPTLRRAGFRFSLGLDWRHPGVQKILVLVTPVTLGISISQAYVIVDRILASLLPEGSIAALNYATKLVQLPVSLFVLAVSTAVFPSLTQWVAKGLLGEVSSAMRRAMRIIILATIPAGVGLMVLRTPIIRLLFERGAFDARATEMTAVAVFFYASGLVALAANILLTRGFYAFQDTKTPVRMLGINIAANIILSLILIRPMGLGGLALAAVLSALLNTFLLVRHLDRRLPGLWHASWLGFTAKVVLAAGALAWAAQAADAALAAPTASLGTAGLALRVTAGIAAGLAAYAAACVALRFEEVGLARREMENLTRRLRRAAFSRAR